MTDRLSDERLAEIKAQTICPRCGDDTAHAQLALPNKVITGFLRCQSCAGPIFFNLPATEEQSDD